MRSYQRPSALSRTLDSHSSGRAASAQARVVSSATAGRPADVIMVMRRSLLDCHRLLVTVTVMDRTADTARWPAAADRRAGADNEGARDAHRQDIALSSK